MKHEINQGPAKPIKKLPIAHKIDAQKTKLTELLKTGISKGEISRILDVNPSSLSRALARYGMQRETISDLDEHIRSILRGLQNKYIIALSSKSLEKENVPTLQTGLGIIEDKLHQASQRSGNNGVAVQINIVSDPSRPEITISHQSGFPDSDNGEKLST